MRSLSLGADLIPTATTLTYSATPLPPGLTLDADDRPDQRHAHLRERGHVHPVTVTVSDGTASGTQTFTWTVTNVNRRPS